MIRSTGVKISDFIEDTDTTSGYFTFVKDGVNYKIASSDLLALFADTEPSSVRYGMMSMQANSTATTISSTSTPVAISGSYTTQANSNFDPLATGGLTYTDATTTFFSVFASVTVAPSSGSDKSISIYFAKNGSVLGDSRMEATVSSSKPMNISTTFYTQLATDDYIEVFVQNATDTTSVIVSRYILKVNG